MGKRIKLRSKIVSIFLAAAAVCVLSSCGNGKTEISSAGASSGSGGEAVASQAAVKEQQGTTLTKIEPLEYFRENRAPEEGENAGMVHDICETVISGERFFGTKRKALEESAVIPTMDSSYRFTCGAFYEDNGELEKLSMDWILEYVTDWGTGEHHLMALIERNLKSLPGADEYASYYGQTLTRQGDVEIVSIGTPETEKCMTFQLGNFWYRVYGSDETPMEDVVAVAEHFLQQPVESEVFAEKKGDEYTWTGFSEYSNVFSGYYPVDSELCGPILTGASEVRLQNSTPFMVFIDYDIGDFPDSVILGWSIYRENPDFPADLWDRSNIAGELDSLTEEDVKEYWNRGIIKFQHSFVFSWDEYLIVARLDSDATPEEMWQILQELKEKNTAG